MDFESLKEQLVDRFFEIKGKVEDSELYIRLKERYDNLTPNAQLGVKIGAALLSILFVYSIPASYLSSANEKMSYFNENRQLTRELIRAGRIARTLELPPSAPTSEALIQRLNSLLEEQNVLPEQKGNISPKADVVAASIVPKAIEQQGIKASIKKLNLRQVVKLGEGLHQIPGGRLFNMTILADQDDPHYFNVDFEVAAFSIPQKPEKPKEDDKKKRGRFGSSGRGQ